MLSFRQVFLGLSLFASAGLVHAAPIVLDAGAFTVTYDDAQTGLYGQGFLSGSLDTVYFQPTAFTAFSAGNPVSTQASLQLAITVNPGYTLTGLSFTERGNYFLSAGGMVDVEASVEALESATSATSVLDLSPGSPLDQGGGSHYWELTGVLPPFGPGSPQTLLITFDNEVTSAPVGGIGFIQKTYAGLRISTEPAAVPEPSGWALLRAGALAAGLAGRRRVRSGGSPSQAA
jgi:hypothetical protein